jgi:hypothetical protein
MCATVRLTDQGIATSVVVWRHGGIVSQVAVSSDQSHAAALLPHRVRSPTTGYH